MWLPCAGTAMPKTPKKKSMAGVTPLRGERRPIRRKGLVAATCIAAVGSKQCWGEPKSPRPQLVRAAEWSAKQHALALMFST
jgi:hypothetical protein